MFDNLFRVWLVILGVFALGCVTGASLDAFYRARVAAERGDGRARREHPRDTVERLRGELDLSDEQASRVRTILEETRDEYRRLRAEARPRYDRIREEGRAAIRAVLTPAQQQIFDRMIAERDARRRERERLDAGGEGERSER